MATTGKRQKKSEFLRDLFRSDPNTREKDAVEAWRRAGNEGTISSSSYFTAKKEVDRRVPCPGSLRREDQAEVDEGSQRQAKVGACP